MRQRADLRFGFLLVFGRELAWLWRRPLLFALVSTVPLVLMAVLMVIFSAGLATRLPIAVLDLDGSNLSRQIIRAVDATPDTAVVQRVAELAEGRRMVLEGRVHGLLMLPRRLEQDVLAGRRAEVVFFYNIQTMTTGNMTLRGVNAAVPAMEGNLRVSLRSAHGEPLPAAQAALQPLPVQVSPLFNPTMNYAHFLLAALLPTVLQILAVTATAYAVGLDVETPHRMRVLRMLGGGLWQALAGKVLPYTLLFITVLGVADAVLFGVLGMPLRGSLGLLLLSGLLFLLACQGIGLVLALYLPMASAISAATLITGPAFGFMGIGFPRIGMNEFAQAWGAILPGTWYLMARVDQTIRGTPLEYSWRPVFVLLGFVLTLASLVVLRLNVLGARRAAVA